jgi:glycosyltransferase involved in cell wall biosynthesis
VTKPGLAAQKFHRLLAEGFGMHPDACAIQTLSAIPVTPANHHRRLWRLPTEIAGNVKYRYIPMINLPVLKNMLVFIGAFLKVILWAICNRTSQRVVICDILNASVSAAALLACRLTGTETLAIVTDLPNLIVSGNKSGLVRRVHNKVVSAFMVNYDRYVLLTEQMNQVVNIHSRPYMVMEGLVDAGVATASQPKKKAGEKIVLYAGSIYEQYGVKTLIEAFMRLRGEDLRLFILGPGAMAEDMLCYTKQDFRITYFGIVHNKEVVQKQSEASLLVNPRPSLEEFAKYSFPSKNMESMASGTPLVTTPLPGMPQEYYPFVYLFDDESVEGMARTLEMLLSKPSEELCEFGAKARQFVLTVKNNTVWAKRILTFLDKKEVRL